MGQISLVILLGLIITTFAIYIINPTITSIKIDNETLKIGIRGVIKTFINQIKPLPKYKYIYNDSEIYNITKTFEGMKVYNIPKEFFEIFGNTIALCFTKNLEAKCVNVSIINNTILINKYPANRTIYIDYSLKDKIIRILRENDKNSLIKILINEIEEGKIRGLKIQDIKLLLSEL